MKTLISTLLFLLTALYLPNSFGKVTRTTNPTTQLQGWTLNDAGLELKIAQILPDQIRAFYMARGFSSEIADDIATHCMMQTVVKNTATTKAAGAITILLKEWQIKPSQDTHAAEPLPLQGIKLKETWDAKWKTDTITPAARIAFRWATFPTEQTFEPNGDYNWGTTSFDLAPTSTFDLHVIWHQNGQRKSTWIQNIQCAEDK